jgi:putative transposase
VTQYRKRPFGGAVLDRLAILQDTAARWSGSVLACQGEPDHLHVLLETVPRVCPSALVNNLKTVSARLLRREFPALRRLPALCAPSYCLISAGAAPIEILRRYLENQDRPA